MALVSEFETPVAGLGSPEDRAHGSTDGAADPNAGGSGEEEPILMAIAYGQGRIFHSTMGHATREIKCVGFTVTLQRGAEWAATGKVTQKVPTEFATETETKSRP